MTESLATLEWSERKNGDVTARVILDHPEKLNVFGAEMIATVTGLVKEASSHEKIRVLILTSSTTRAFSGGANIHEFAQLDPDGAERFIRSLHELCAAVRTCPVPVIAAIHGYCLGGALELAASCDLRVASEDAQFGMPEVRVGLPSVIEARLLPLLIGWGKTAELLYTGELIDADEALRCGLVERVVEGSEVDDAVEDWVNPIVASGPQAIRTQKRLIRRWQETSIETGIEESIQAFRRSYESGEPAVYTKPFLERK
jgi:enoyl-CoA hydratase/carnithine racemase